MWNVEGLQALQSHTAELNLFGNADILVLTETLTTDENYVLEGYYGFIQAAPEAVMGSGIGVFVKPHLNPTFVSKSEHHVAVRTAEMDVIGCYFPPATPVEDVLLCVIDAVSSLESPARRDHLMILGDFNCRIDQGDRGETLAAVLREQIQVELHNPANQHTFCGPQGSSTIDLVFSNRRPESVKVIPTMERRHSRVEVFWSSEAVSEKPTTKKKRKINTEELRNDPNLIHVEPLLAAGATSVAAELISTSIISAAPDVPERKKHHKDWFDAECMQLKNEAMSSRGSESFWEKKKKYKRVCREKRRKFEDEVLARKIDDAEVRPWELFAAERKKSAAPVPLEKWETHFTHLLNPDRAPPDIVLPESQEEEERETAWYNIEVSRQDVENAIANTRNGKAAGPDRITNEHLKAASPVIVPFLVLLFNTCLRLGCIAAAWKNSFVVALFKGKGSPSEPSNYRGIALLNTVFKVLTKILNWRIMDNIANILPPEQYGFRPGKGTKEAIDILLTHIKSKISVPRGKTYAAFVDFEKAFDSVSRPKLIQKLHSQFNVKGLTLRLIATILGTNFIRIFDGLRKTDPIEQTRGVLQGDSLSPTLFLTFVSDLADLLREIPNLNFLFYADDVL